jgi:hypothetical protein
MTDRVRRISYKARLLNERAKRLAIAAKKMGFTVRDAYCGPTLEFPGVDIDRIHRRKP